MISGTYTQVWGDGIDAGEVSIGAVFPPDASERTTLMIEQDGIASPLDGRALMAFGCQYD